MRAVCQRVTEARVRVDGASVGEVGAGLCVLLGVRRGDEAAAAERLAGKVARLRVFDGMDRSLLDTGGGALVVSQFTLYGDVRRGRRPSFDAAAPPEQARGLYEAFVRELRSAGIAVSTGEFQAMMQVELVNDGPVTILVDSRRTF
jgi:D-tyrosyl-tRNA(Tyr) deacylase